MYKILHTGHHGYSFWIVTLLRTLIRGVWYQTALSSPRTIIYNTLNFTENDV